MVSFEEIQAAYYMVAATGVLIAAIFYILNMRAQRRTREAQLFMGVYQHFYSTEYQDHYFTIAHREVKNNNDYMNMLEDRDFSNAIGTYHAYYEGIGILVKEGLVDIRLVAHLMSGPVRWFWERYEPVVLEARREYNWPRMMIEVEYLYNTLNEYAARHPELQVASPSIDIPR